MGLDLKRQRTTLLEKSNNDYLCVLPEHLFHHILSFLPMKDVIRTCVLSKRWRYIWSTVPCLNFPMQMSIKKEIDFIDQCLLLYSSPIIQKLNISLKKRLKADTHQVDWWIYFGCFHKVKEFHLEFMYTSSRNYTLLRNIFFCKFLTVLELKNCNIDVSKTYILVSLETISLKRVDIRGGSFYDLTSSCPRLERVSLINCNMKAGSGRSITNVSLKTLKIWTSSYQTSNEVVYAPHLVSFESRIIASDEKICVFGRMQALENARFICGKLHWDCCPNNNKIRLAIYLMLDNIRHVKTLRLDSCYLEVMSIREKKGNISSFAVKYLEIQTGLTKMEIPGIAYMLKSSPQIETLIINIEKISEVKLARNSYNNPYSEEGGYWKDQEPIIFGKLDKLKIVRVYNFMKNLKAVHVDGAKTKVGEYIKKLRSDMDLLKCLLKNCEGLEKMIITTFVDFKPKSMRSRLMRVLKKDLLAAPATNRDVEISIT